MVTRSTVEVPGARAQVGAGASEVTGAQRPADEAGNTASPAVTTGEDQRADHLRPFRWLPGQSGNPRGRTKGSRHRLSEVFLTALADDFEKHAEEVIRACRETDPVAYLRIVASLMPKDVSISPRPLEDMTDDELREALATIDRYLSVGAPALAADPGGRLLS